MKRVLFKEKQAQLFRALFELGGTGRWVSSLEIAEHLGVKPSDVTQSLRTYEHEFIEMKTGFGPRHRTYKLFRFIKLPYILDNEIAMPKYIIH